MSTSLIELEIVALSHNSANTHSYAIVLGEVNGVRRIPIVIGGAEAQAIAVSLERMSPSRPLTHDLFRNTMVAFGIYLKHIIIYKIEEGIFFSKLVCEGENGTIEIDSRTSDALAMAVRFQCNIYTNAAVMTSAGSQLDEKGASSLSTEAAQSTAATTAPKDEMKKLTIPELNAKLDEVLADEDYIAAAKIRDEIKRRKEG